MTETTQIQNETHNPEGFAALFEASATRIDALREGDIVAGTILKVGKDSVVVDIGYKSEGVISLHEFINAEGNISATAGDAVDVLIESKENEDGLVMLSKEKADKLKVWDEISAACERDELIEGTITQRVKGGLAVTIRGGVKAFLPGSQVDLRPVAALFEASATRTDALREGDIVAGTILKVGKDSVVVDIGYKSEGVISLHEFINAEGNISATAGDAVDVLIESKENEDGLVMLSKEKADKLKVWDEISAACERDELIEGTITQRVKGGLSVTIRGGVKAFLPGSQVDLRPVRNLDALLGQTFQFKVIKFNKKRGNIVLSRRVLLEKERDRLKEATLENLQEDQVVTGIDQEHHRVRCVRGPRRHRRPASHHRHELGPGQSPVRGLRGRRRGHRQGAQVQRRHRARLARPQADHGRPVERGDRPLRRRARRSRARSCRSPTTAPSSSSSRASRASSTSAR